MVLFVDLGKTSIFAYIVSMVIHIPITKVHSAESMATF